MDVNLGSANTPKFLASATQAATIAADSVPVDKTNRSPQQQQHQNNKPVIIDDEDDDDGTQGSSIVALLYQDVIESKGRFHEGRNGLRAIRLFENIVVIDTTSGLQFVMSVAGLFPNARIARKVIFGEHLAIDMYPRDQVALLCDCCACYDPGTWCDCLWKDDEPTKCSYILHDSVKLSRSNTDTFTLHFKQRSKAISCGMIPIQNLHVGLNHCVPCGAQYDEFLRLFDRCVSAQLDGTDPLYKRIHAQTGESALWVHVLPARSTADRLRGLYISLACRAAFSGPHLHTTITAWYDAFTKPLGLQFDPHATMTQFLCTLPPLPNLGPRRGRKPDNTIASQLQTIIEQLPDILSKTTTDVSTLGFIYAFVMTALEFSKSTQNYQASPVAKVELAATKVFKLTQIESKFLEALRIPEAKWTTASLIRRFMARDQKLLSLDAIDRTLRRVDTTTPTQSAASTAVVAAAADAARTTTNKRSISDSATTSTAKYRCSSPPRGVYSALVRTLFDYAEHMKAIRDAIDKSDAVMISSAWINSNEIIQLICRKCLIVVFYDDHINAKSVENGLIQRDSLLINNVSEFKLPDVGLEQWRCIPTTVARSRHVNNQETFGDIMHDKVIVFGKLIYDSDDDNDRIPAFLPCSALVGSFNLTNGAINQSNSSVLLHSEACSRAFANNVAERARNAKAIN